MRTHERPCRDRQRRRRFALILLREDAGVAVLTLNRPQTRNAFPRR